MARKIRQVSSSVATVMPEIGLEDEPISPVSRDDTVTKRKPNSTMSSAPSRFMCRGGASTMATMMARMPPKTKRHRQVVLGAVRVDARLAAQAHVAQALADAVPDDGQRADEADDAARRHGAGADVEHVGAADLRSGAISLIGIVPGESAPGMASPKNLMSGISSR